LQQFSFSGGIRLAEASARHPLPPKVADKIQEVEKK
jgi:hypothetical protein